MKIKTFVKRLKRKLQNNFSITPLVNHSIEIFDGDREAVYIGYGGIYNCNFRYLFKSILSKFQSSKFKN